VAGNFNGPVEGRGVLFVENNKKHDKAPDLKGEIMIDGKKIRLAGWKKRTQYGELISLAVDNYQPKQAAPKSYPREVETKDAGDVPW